MIASVDLAIIALYFRRNNSGIFDILARLELMSACTTKLTSQVHLQCAALYSKSEIILKFDSLELQPEINEALKDLGFTECTEIQEASIPLIAEGKDVAGLAQTGTGKTAAFLLPLIDRILKSRLEELEAPKRAFQEWQKNQFILVLVPTRELAEQVFDNFKKLAAKTDLKGVSIYGGVSYDKQKKALHDGAEFVIATPGRLIDLFKEHLVDLRQVRAVVFDEADRMFDMGFKDDMKYILQRIPKERQFLVFSATLNFDVLNTAYQFSSDPIEVNVSKDQTRAENVEDEIFHAGQGEKPKFLLSLIKKHKPNQAIIFSNFKMNVGRIARFLSENGVPAVGISSLLSQAQRNRVMDQFKSDNDQNILVATDVAARGLDIKGVDLVINFDLPDDPENYVHRIGRTGRANAKGIAFSLVSDRDVDALMRIEEYLKNKLTTGWLEDSDMIQEFEAFPRDDREVRRPGRKPRNDRSRDRKSNERRSEGGKGKRRANHSRGKSSDEKTAQDGNVHRDRKSGRHKSKSKNDRRKSAKPAKGGRRGEDKRLQGGRQRRKPTTVQQKRPANASLGQKVVGFFKKLFD